MAQRGVVLSLVFTILTTPLFARDCRAFLIEREADVRISPIVVAEGRMEVVISSVQTGVIDVLLPPGPGGSASLAKLTEPRTHLLRCTNGTLSHQVRTADGKTTSFPERSMEDLGEHDIRVSVVGGDGTRGAFYVSRYDTVEADPGPVQNLFAAAPIPLGADGYVVTTSTYRRRAGSLVEGSFPIEADGHLFAEGIGPDGTKGWFIIDTGAAQSVVVKSYLPKGTSIDAANMIEYSSAGRRVLDYAPAGATGTIKGIVGHAKIASIRFGDARFDNVEAAVMEELPASFGRPVVGILGLEQLRRSKALDLRIPAGGKGSGKISFGSGEALAGGIAFSIVSEHIAIPTRIGETTTWMILDTGSPVVLLDDEAASKAGLSGTESRALGGLDNNRVQARASVIEQLTVDQQQLDRVPCRITRLTVFDQFRIPGQSLGLLGNDVLGRFSRITIDFEHRRAHFRR